MQYRLIDHKSREYCGRFLQSIYVLTNLDKEHTYGCVPNGEIGISIILRGEAHINKGASWLRQPSLSIYGLIKSIQFHRMSAGYHEFNLGFDPHILQLFLNDSMSSLVEREATDLFMLFPRYEVEKLYEDIATACTDSELLDRTECFLKRNLQPHKIDKRLLSAYELIDKNKLLKVEEISSQLNVSSATLRNLFREKAGIAPKELIRIHRIRQALGNRNADEESLTALAYELGYYDQSHFIHDFKEAVGLTPRKYFDNEKLVFDFYNYGRWSYSSFASINE